MRKIIFTITVAVLLSLTGCSDKYNEDGSPKPPSGYPNEFLLKAAYFVGLVDLKDTEPPVPDDIAEYKDIVYKETESRPLKLDIYHLKNLNKPAPVLIFIHGGGWRKGDKHDYLAYLLDYAKKGYVTATVAYRFSQEAHFSAAVLDVKCAVRWIRSHAAQYMIDPHKIAVIGGSAGGYLALMAGYTYGIPEFETGCNDTIPVKVQAVVDLYGPTDLTTPYAIKQKSPKQFLGKSYDEDPALYLKASPKTYISADDPPTLIFQGTIDALVPYTQSDSLKIWLDRAGVPAEYHKLKGWPHTMDLVQKVNDYCQYYMDRFFKRYLK